VKLTTHLHSIAEVQNGGAIPPLSVISLWRNAKSVTHMDKSVLPSRVNQYPALETCNVDISSEPDSGTDRRWIR
jgi:hypothetical protein